MLNVVEVELTLEACDSVLCGTFLPPLAPRFVGVKFKD